MSIPLQKRRFTVTEYHRMAEAGILSEDEPVELLEGEIVEMTPIGSRHASCVKRLNRLFHQKSSRLAIVSVQDPVQLSANSEPQPDVALLRPREDDYARGHPQPPDVLLIVEVAQTSTEADHRVKIPFYARSGIREVWVVDLEKAMIETFRSPSAGRYRDIRSYGRGESIRPQALPGLEVSVDQILPPESRQPQ